MLFLLQSSLFPGPGPRQGQGERAALSVAPLQTDDLTSLSQVTFIEPEKISRKGLLLETSSKPNNYNTFHTQVYS